MDCFQDFCLNCDRQATSGPYCSQTCKLADLDRGREPSTSTSTSQQQQSWPSTSPRSAPNKAVDWTRTYTQPSLTDNSSSSSSYFMRSSAQETSSHERQRSLTPSSSRSSLSSNTSNANSSAISEQAKQELQAFFNAFDQARASKRRQSTW